MISLKGLHYRSKQVYDFCSFIKLGFAYNLRYKIAARYIPPNQSVIDVCSAAGDFKKFLSKNCTYTAIESSPQFCKILQERNISYVCCNLHEAMPNDIPCTDVLAMIISLSQFRKTSVHELLEYFKKIARRVVIVEDVLPQTREENSFYQKVVNYLCATDYYVPVTWFTHLEFSKLMDQHGYQYKKITERYCVGIYEPHAH